MAALDNDITRDLYNAGVSRHAFTLLVDLARIQARQRYRARST